MAERVLQNISLSKNRDAEGVDRLIPLILKDDMIYDDALDRFLLDLPLNGTRSPHSLRCFGYDLVVWLRFLFQARDKSVWDADYDDVLAYHRARRRPDAPNRVSASTWNRSVASLDKLYRWGVEERLIAKSPFKHRKVWRQGHGGRRGAIEARNTAYETSPVRSNIKFISLEHYRRFVSIGLRGRGPDGQERPGARDRNGERNALFADLLVSTGLRLEEASSIFAIEVQSILAKRRKDRQLRFRLPAPITKGDRGRTIMVPAVLAKRITDYIELEREAATEKFRSRKICKRIDRAIFVETVQGDHGVEVVDPDFHQDRLRPDERARVVFCRDGKPYEPASLWLSEVGMPVRPNTWDATFMRASKRCSDNGFPISVSPHTLRHTFAVHMLAMLIEEQLKSPEAPDSDMETYRRLLGDPLQQVQRLLGHASITTTYIYLDYLASEADTIDSAVERLLATLDHGYIL